MLTSILLFHKQKDVLLDGYKRHLTAASAPPPLTMAEEELQIIRQNEVRGHQLLCTPTWDVRLGPKWVRLVSSWRNQGLFQTRFQ